MPSTHMTAIGRPKYFAVSTSGDVMLSGALPPEGSLATPWPVIADDDENTFLGKAVGLAVDYKPLPDSGEVTAGEIYGYGGGLVIVRQTHQRTGHAPKDVPALFSVYRAGASGPQEWVANEKVMLGTHRIYEGVEYVAIQAHVTKSDWTPPAVPALWKAVVIAPPVGAWATGVAYKVNAEVTYSGNTYRCLQAHESQAGWNPPAVPALWSKI